MKERYIARRHERGNLITNEIIKLSPEVSKPTTQNKSQNPPHFSGITVYGTLDKFVKMFWQNSDEGHADTWIAGDIKNEIIMRFKCALRSEKAQYVMHG